MDESLNNLAQSFLAPAKRRYGWSSKNTPRAFSNFWGKKKTKSLDSARSEFKKSASRLAEQRQDPNTTYVISHVSDSVSNSKKAHCASKWRPKLNGSNHARISDEISPKRTEPFPLGKDLRLNNRVEQEVGGQVSKNKTSPNECKSKSDKLISELFRRKSNLPPKVEKGFFETPEAVVVGRSRSNIVKKEASRVTPTIGNHSVDSDQLKERSCPSSPRVTDSVKSLIIKLNAAKRRQQKKIPKVMNSIQTEQTVPNHSTSSLEELFLTNSKSFSFDDSFSDRSLSSECSSESRSEVLDRSSPLTSKYLPSVEETQPKQPELQVECDDSVPGIQSLCVEIPEKEPVKSSIINCDATEHCATIEKNSARSEDEPFRVPESPLQDPTVTTSPTEYRPKTLKVVTETNTIGSANSEGLASLSYQDGGSIRCRSPQRKSSPDAACAVAVPEMKSLSCDKIRSTKYLTIVQVGSSYKGPVARFELDETLHLDQSPVKAGLSTHGMYMADTKSQMSSSKRSNSKSPKSNIKLTNSSTQRAKQKENRDQKLPAIKPRSKVCATGISAQIVAKSTQAKKGKPGRSTKNVKHVSAPSAQQLTKVPQTRTKKQQAAKNNVQGGSKLSLTKHGNLKRKLDAKCALSAKHRDQPPKSDSSKKPSAQAVKTIPKAQLQTKRHAPVKSQNKVNHQSRAGSKRSASVSREMTEKNTKRQRKSTSALDLTEYEETGTSEDGYTSGSIFALSELEHASNTLVPLTEILQLEENLHAGPVTSGNSRASTGLSSGLGGLFSGGVHPGGVWKSLVDER